MEPASVGGGERADQVSSTTCRVCLRTFPSLKSLYGHMRCHKREWKGVDPPPDHYQAEKKRRKLRDGNESDDRRRHCSEGSRVEVIVSYRGALNLLHFQSRGQWKGTLIIVTGRVELSDDPTDDEVYKFFQQQQQKHADVVAGEAEQPKRHACNICNKSFSSHQALGGHVAGCHKNSSSNNVVQRAATDPRGTARPPQQQQHIQAMATGRRHRCEQCSMLFPTGQALGGHKRKHYEKEK